MRVQIYEEEMGEPVEVSVVRTKAANTGIYFLGLRVWLRGADSLHDTPEDDDRSAVTFWAADSEEGLLLLEELCHQMMLRVREAQRESRG